MENDLDGKIQKMYVLKSNNDDPPTIHNKYK